MTEKAPIFNKIIKEYLLQVAHIEAKDEVGASLGISFADDGFKIPFFHRTYTVSTDRIVDADGGAASHVVSVTLCKYLLLRPDQPSDDFSLVTYKDFRDAAPYVGGFRNTAEQPIARHFEGALPQLEKRCLALGGHSFDTEVSCQLALRFEALPKVPLFLLFNDADEDFPAQATLLFQKNGASYLDMECLAMIGASLAYRLQEN
ncbi:MAG: DUF3786 domain-containing protein [Pseudomonadota bacterium]